MSPFHPEGCRPLSASPEFPTMQELIGHPGT